MKILSLTPYCEPEQIASTHLSHDREDAFAANGIDTVVYTPTPCRGVSEEVAKEYKKKEHRRDVYDGGHRVVYRFPMYSEGSNPVMRALRYAFVGIKHFNKAVFNKEARSCDVMYIASTPPFQGALAGIVKKFTKQPIVYNLQDIFPDSLVGAGLTHKGSLLWNAGRKIENFTYRHADKIIVISEDIKRNLIAKGVPESKIEVIYNWIDEDAVVPVAKADNPLFEELCLSRGKFNVVYAGNLGNAQNIDVIIDAAELLKDKGEIEFIIFGTGGLKEQFVQKAADLGLDNVRFFPLQPMERVAHVYGLGDICVVSCKPGFGGAAMPSKTMSILSAGRPVLASFDEGELTDILNENDCGVSVPAGDAGAFADVVGDLAADRLRCDEMGRNGRELILRKFTREVGTKRYVDVIKSVSDEKV